MANNVGFVSVIIPCRNEEKLIAKCLDSIVESDYPKDKLEVFVIDGMSTDRTREIIRDYTQKYSFIKFLENPKKVIPSAMNIGIKNSSGEIIMKFDAHASYQKDYISKCVKYLIEYNADNVGGLIIALPRRDTLIGRAIIKSLSSPFGVGNSSFRTGTDKPIWTDTAFSGCYRRDVFDRIGLYDENIARSEDVDINSRIRRSGGKILLVPEIVSHYYARSGFGEFCRHNFDNGIWITYPLKFDTVLFSWRHLIPLIFVSGLIGSATLSFFSQLFLWLFLFVIGSYTLTNLYFSAKIASKEKKFGYFCIMPIVFATLHIGYGLGSIWGLLKAIFSVKFWKNRFAFLKDRKDR